MNNKSFISLLMAMLLSTSLFAAEVDWSFNPYAYRYDMTVYIDMENDGNAVSDMTNYKIGAFCGEECRGVVEVKTVGGHTYGYLRVRSNVESGETITFKMMELETGKTYSCNDTVDFKSLSAVGMPSSPCVLAFAEDSVSELGDVNGDGVVDYVDAAEIIVAYMSNTTSTLDKSVADVNKDGVIDYVDAAAIQVMYMNNKK